MLKIVNEKLFVLVRNFTKNSIPFVKKAIDDSIFPQKFDKYPKL